MKQDKSLIPIHLGTDLNTNRAFHFDFQWLKRHLWLMGATGSGKTVFILRLLARLIRGLSCSIIVIDKMGGLSRDLEKFLASRSCPPLARERALIIRPSLEDRVFPMFPIDGTAAASDFYQVEKTTDLAMRLWRSQDMSLQARLRKWSFNLLFAMMQLGLNIRPSEYLLNPRADEHKPLLRRLSGRVKQEWLEILNANGSEPVRILESARNRWSPFFECSQLRRMTASNRNHLDITKFRSEKKIIIVDLSPGLNQLTPQVSNGIAGMFLNDIISSARVANSCGIRLPETVIVLDEFQDFVSQDLLEALPQTRQMNLSFVLSHQSMSQLKQGEVDLTEIVWQAQNMGFFRNYGLDGDVAAQEKAVYDYDENEIKDERTTMRQRNVGHEIRITHGGGTTETTTTTRSDQTQVGEGSGYNRPLGVSDSLGTFSENKNTSSASGTGDSTGTAQQTSWRETLVPILEDFEEVSGRTYRQFEEVFNAIRRHVRQMPVGQCFLKPADEMQFRHLAINPLFIPDTPYIQDRVAELEENNFSSNLFVPASVIDREDQLLRQQILCGAPLRFESSPQTTPGKDDVSSPPPHDSDSNDGVFG